jgi:amylosucrase/maltose alpha-D-glucosyltransferase/alpha-amylase
MVFKSEAIVHPDEVNKYISEEECQLSYNPQLMALLWNSLATRDVTLLRHALVKRFDLPQGCAWVNYVRCHDDIGWMFSDDDAIELGIDPRDHRQFLTGFFVGRFEGSFARGQMFQENPETSDARVSGTTASLAGLEVALESRNDKEIELAIQRIILLYGVAFTIGGIPLIYLGDELGMLNYYLYEDDPEKRGDSRWLHRLEFDWGVAEQRFNRTGLVGKVYSGMLRLAQLRQQNLAFTRAETEIIDTGNKHVLGYFRHHSDQSVLVLANFTENEQIISAKRLRLLGLRKTITDIVAGRTVVATEHLPMAPYQIMILVGVR